jgi:hypothetical protein
MLLMGTFYVVALNTVSADLVAGEYWYTVSNGEATITNYNGSGGVVTIPSTLGGYPVVYIGDNAFENDGGHLITSVIIPSSVITIGNFAFDYCSSLTSVTIPDSVTTIGMFAFASCSFTSVTIPNSVTTIGEYAFAFCSSLASVTIPDSVTTIGMFAFVSCSSLASVTIPDSVRTIEQYTFQSTGLTTVAIPDSVTTIGDNAFQGSSLTSVTIGSGITNIGSSVFSGFSLTSITFLGLIAPPVVSPSWIGGDGGTYVGLKGHAYADSDFPAPGGVWNGLTMGEYIIGIENKPPVASFTWTPSTPTINQGIAFNASTSSDPDGSILTYEWDWNNDGTYEGFDYIPTATHSWAQAGNYSVKLQVIDNGGLTSTKTITIYVTSGGGNGGTNNKGTPGFELILVISAIAMILFLKRKRK